MGAAASAGPSPGKVRGNGIDSTHALLAWIADVDILQWVDGTQKQLSLPGACPARLEVLDGACVFDMVIPGGFAVKLFLDADTCTAALGFTSSAAVGAIHNFLAIVVQNTATRTPGTAGPPFVMHP